MTDKRKTLDELFEEHESDLDRRARERREAEEAYRKTPEGAAEHERFLEELRKREAERASEPEIDEEDEPDEDEEEDEDPEDDD
jgi:hypothetical protein